MATSDSDIIQRARSLTDYDDSIYSDAELQGLLEICKDELRAEWGDDTYQFYDGPLVADQALFWYLVVAAKIRAGEIAGSNINIADIELRNPAHVHHEVLLERLSRKVRQAAGAINEGENAGAAIQNIERDDERTYSYE